MKRLLSGLRIEPTAKHQTYLALFLGAVLVVPLAVIIASVSVPRGSETWDGPAGATILSFREAPTDTWQVRIEDFYDDENAYFTAIRRPVAREYPVGVFAFGDVVVTSATPGHGDPSATLMGIDADTGQISWTEEFGPLAGRERTVHECFGPLGASLFGCNESPDGTWASATEFVLREAHTGEVHGRQDLEHAVSAATVYDDAIVTAQLLSDDVDAGLTLRLAATTTTGLEERWSITLHVEPPQISEDVYLYHHYVGRDPELIADEDTVEFRFGPTRVSLMADSGELIEARADLSYATESDAEGSEWQLAAVEDSHDVFASGDVVVHAPGWYRGELASTFSVYDPGTGNLHFSASAEVPFAAIPGADAYVGRTRSSLVAYSYRDEGLLWEMPIPAGRNGHSESFGYPHHVSNYTTDRALISVDQQTITGFTGFAQRDPDDDGRSPTGSGDTQQAADDTYITRCGSVPEIELVDITEEVEGMSVVVRLTATCPSGQYIDSDAFRITLSEPGGSGGSGGFLLGSAVFDFSSVPLFIGPGGSTTLHAHFPVGTIFRLPSDIDTTTVLVECDDEGTAGSQRRDIPAGGWPSSHDASAVSPGSSEAASELFRESALDALERQARLDRPFVSSDLDGYWVPQLSSKQPGTVDQGITWNHDSIYRNHLELRLRYPEVRLLWSGDWASYRYGDFWVSVAGVTYETGEEAVAWCDRNGFDPTQCYAKLISSTGSHEGTTMHRE